MPRSPAPTVNAILQAGFRLFFKRGYARVSMDDIAAEAGVTKRTLYYHFDSKDALVGAVLEEQALQSAKSMTSWSETDPAGVDDYIAHLFDNLLAWAKTRHWTGSGFSRLVLELADMPGHPARVSAADHKKAVEAQIAASLRDCGAPDSDVLARSLAVIIEGAMVLTLIHRDRGYIESAKETALKLGTGLK